MDNGLDEVSTAPTNILKFLITAIDYYNFLVDMMHLP